MMQIELWQLKRVLAMTPNLAIPPDFARKAAQGR